MTLSELIVMIVIAVLVGIIGEMLAHRRTAFGFGGATVVGFIAIFLVKNVLGWHLIGEPFVYGVPLITSIIAAALLVALWSAFAYWRLYRYTSRSDRRWPRWRR